MVATRGHSSGTAFHEGTNVEDTIVLDTPRSPRKRSRSTMNEADFGDEILPKSGKRTRVLPVREKDKDVSKRTMSFVVEIPAGNLASKLRDIRRNTEEDTYEDEAQGAIVVEEDVSTEGEDSSNEDMAEKDDIESHIPAWDKREVKDSKSDDESEAAEGASTPEPALLEQKIKSATPPRGSIATSIPAQPKHRRFDTEDSEPEPEFFSTAVETIVSEEDISDDDAPEVLAAQDALESAQTMAQQAAKVLEQREVAIRKKRQDRNSRLKTQAEAKAKKRDRIEKKAARNASKQMEQNPKDGKGAIVDTRDPRGTVPAGTKIVIKSSSLPDLLPEEYLQDDEETEPHTELEMEVRRTTPRKKRFSGLVEKRPKGRKIGSTTYIISESHSKLLAPKSAFQAKNTKESWLKGRGPITAGGVRKVPSSGFFTKRKAMIN